MKINDILTEQGVIVKGVNTTVDVNHQVKLNAWAAKLFPMNKGGKPSPLINDKVLKNSNHTYYTILG